MGAAVVTIGYNRSWSLAKSLRRLARAEGVLEHDCFLFLDAPYRDEDREKCEDMYHTAEEIKRTMLPHLRIIRRERNYGVPGNLISAVSEIFEKYDKIIFFEDDVCISRTFLVYMDRALDYYAGNPKVFCINGFQIPTIRVPKNYQFDVYATPRNMAWGFGIWKDRWFSVDFDMKDWPTFKANPQNLHNLENAGYGLLSMCENQYLKKLHTWDVQCTFHMVEHGLVAIEPIVSLSKNIGWGEESIHCKSAPTRFLRMKYCDFLPARFIDNLEPYVPIWRQVRDALLAKYRARRIFRRLFQSFIRRYGNDPIAFGSDKNYWI